MDALVKTALDKVNKTIESLPWDKIEKAQTTRIYYETLKDPMTKAIYTVDALKSALKAINLSGKPR